MGSLGAMPSTLSEFCCFQITTTILKYFALEMRTEISELANFENLPMLYEQQQKL